jgi:biotin synthase-related radical SAM superfamily protein
LNASSTQEFVIEFTIPADAPIKAYLVNLIVKSDEFEEYLKMKINILEVLPREKIQEKINDLEEESVNLGNRLDELKRVGVEVVAVERLLEVAKEKLDEARSELQIENYGKASEILHDVEILLDDIEETILTGPFKIKPLSLILGGVILTGILALSVGKIRLLSKGKKVEEKKLKYSFLKKIQSAFASRNCPRCHREMQEMYKDNKLIGYRCSKCKYTRYKGG